jgi:UDP-N-acetylglucosamine acyltransferase
MTKVHGTAIIEAGAELGENVEVGPYCVVGPCVRIGDGCRILSHVVVDGHTTLGRDCALFPFASIGTQTQDLKYRGGTTFVEIGDRTTLREYVTVNSGTNEGEVTRVGADCHIMAYCHVAHACQVGNRVIMSNCATLAGEITVEDEAIIGGLSGVHQFVRIGRLCMIGGLTPIRQDCPPFTMIAGNPPEVKGLNTVGMQRRGIDPEAQKLLKHAYRLVYREDLSTSQALERIRGELTMCPEIEQFVSFIEKSERGITK